MGHVFIENKNFRYLMLGKLVSLIGSNLQIFALSLHVLKITGSATEFSKILIISLIPEIILTPFAGVIVDWLDRKKIIVYSDLLSGIIIAAYVLFFNAGLNNLISIYILSFIISIISALFQPAILTIIPSIVDDKDLEDANSVNSGIMNVGELISPFIAGILMYRFGINFILYANAVSFILSAFSEMFIDIPPLERKEEHFSLNQYKEDFKEGFNFIYKTNGLKMIILLGIGINFILSPITTIGVTYIYKVIIGVNDKLYGFAESIAAFSMIIAPIVFSAYKSKSNNPYKIIMGMIYASLTIFLMGLVVSSVFKGIFTKNQLYYLFIVLEFLLIFFISISNIALVVIFQKIVPLEKMGRVSAILNASCMIAAPLGQFFIALLYDYVSATITTMFMGGVFLLVVLINKKRVVKTLEDDLEYSKY
ncbi:MFS transporter [Caloranaerobacter azorensis]|uniref:MFS transporter n=1 Tax=Caloranaerobacter azorensis TaxID=116090 RepID=UPI000690C89C|nr:MFS transporter [Caloranaerobacter azorensis]